ncbi:MAG: hypothetical protein ACRECX_07925 [Methyloceanibacter sp.]|uniref:hypothetical protein n=1 Tax=Methyloceanibacter sp. TaxID=1965321 RepID=UPI003D6D9E34
MVLAPAPPAKPTNEPAPRPLAYQQAITQPKPAAKEPGDGPKPDIGAFDTVTTDAKPESLPATGSVTPPAMPDLPPEEGSDTPQGTAALSDEGADTQGADQDVAAFPGGEPAPYDGVPPEPGEAGADQWGTDGAEQWDDERSGPWAHGSPQADPYGTQADPYGGDPNGPPQAGQFDGEQPTEWANEATEEWVQVILSGAAMRAAAADDAPMLFAFPYGRNLKVVSRYEGWVEVTDPQSAATGWMQAHNLAPTAGNRQPYGQSEAYYEDEPRRGGWIKRNTGGFADMINRALGGF